MRTLLLLTKPALILCLAGVLAGCPKKQEIRPSEPPVKSDYTRPLPPGELALRKITDPAQIPDFTPACANLAGLRLAIDNSLEYMAKPSSQRYSPYGQITHEQVVASLNAFGELIDQNLPPAQMNAAIREQFDTYISVGWDYKGTVLFTAYYTPILNASLVKTGKFTYPLYKQPPKLKKDAEGNILGLETAGGLVLPPSREEIDAGRIPPEMELAPLAWLSDPFEVYIAHVQGSAQLRLPDGNMMTVGYAATNGHAYRSVAMELVKDGKIPKESLSLQAMIDYFKMHPEQVAQYVSRNPRYVFFDITDGGPRGSLNEPVTAWRTIATDKTIYPRASVAMVALNKLPRPSFRGIEELPYKGFACDQDTGGAIRAAGRCDIYVGIGDQAGQLAGRTMQEGRLYYLFLKPSLMPKPVLQAAPTAGPAAKVKEVLPAPPAKSPEPPAKPS
jgi:membrane-bound lytic murein transglycosylase A